MLTGKQIAGNQKRSVRAIIEKISALSEAFADVDGMMEAEAERFREAAEEYLEQLQLYIDDAA